MVDTSYQVIAFDAPTHDKSTGSQVDLNQFGEAAFDDMPQQPLQFRYFYQRTAAECLHRTVNGVPAAPAPPDSEYGVAVNVAVPR